VRGAPQHYTYRLFGSRVSLLNNMDQAGRRVMDLPWPELAERAVRDNAEVAQTGTPAFNLVHLAYGEAGHFSAFNATYSRLLLPLAGKTGIERLLVAINVRPIPELEGPRRRQSDQQAPGATPRLVLPAGATASR
jgi:hypothetical protein